MPAKKKATKPKSPRPAPPSPDLIEKYLINYEGDGPQAATLAGVKPEEMTCFIDQVMSRHDVLKRIVEKLNDAIKKIAKNPKRVVECLNAAGITLEYLAERLFTIIDSEPVVRREYAKDGSIAAEEFGGYKDHVKAIEMCYRLMAQLAPERRMLDEATDGTGKPMRISGAVVFFQRAQGDDDGDSRRTIIGQIS